MFAGLTTLVTHVATIRAFQFTKEEEEAEGRLDWAKQQIMPSIALFGGSDLEELLRWIRNPDAFGFVEQVGALREQAGNGVFERVSAGWSE